MAISIHQSDAAMDMDLQPYPAFAFDKRDLPLANGLGHLQLAHQGLGWPVALGLTLFSPL